MNPTSLLTSLFFMGYSVYFTVTLIILQLYSKLKKNRTYGTSRPSNMESTTKTHQCKH